MKRAILSLIAILIFGLAANAQTTEFTYQGNLKDGTNLANGNYDFEFRLFAVDTGGTALNTLQRLAVPVANGVFSVKLDFGALFPGAFRYLEIAVKPAGSGGGFQQLLPRQVVSNTPYSIRSLNAANADNATNATNATTVATAGNVTGVVAIANGGTGSAAKNFVDLSTDQSAIGGNKTFTGNLTVNGNVGVGTNNPTQKLYVSGTGGIRANVNSDSNAGLGLTLNNAPKWSVATVSPGQFQIFNDAIGQNAVWIDPTNNNVGIGSATTTAKLEVNGYTKLGSDAPAIKVKKLTGTTSATNGGGVDIPHGLDPTKILSISVMVNWTDNDWVPSGYTIWNGFLFNWELENGVIHVYNSGFDASIRSKPFKILVTYEQ